MRLAELLRWHELRRDPARAPEARDFERGRWGEHLERIEACERELERLTALRTAAQADVDAAGAAVATAERVASESIDTLRALGAARTAAQNALHALGDASAMVTNAQTALDAARAALAAAQRADVTAALSEPEFTRAYDPIVHRLADLEVQRHKLAAELRAAWERVAELRRDPSLPNDAEGFVLARHFEHANHTAACALTADGVRIEQRIGVASSDIREPPQPLTPFEQHVLDKCMAAGEPLPANIAARVARIERDKHARIETARAHSTVMQSLE